MASIVGFFLWKWNIVRASKVFVCSIQKYLCGPFKSICVIHSKQHSIKHSRERDEKILQIRQKKMRHKFITPSGAGILSNMGQNRWLHCFFHFFQKFFWFVDQKSCICNVFLPLLPLILCEQNLVGIMSAFVAPREFLREKLSEDYDSTKDVPLSSSEKARDDMI